ncbi:MAG: arginine--tRNA ligase [Patescibacteria group bacterium]
MMIEIKKNILKKINKFSSLEKIDLLIPPKSEMGDLAFACFNLTDSPVEKATELAQLLNKEKIAFIKEVKNFGPYVNFYFDYEKLAQKILGDILQNKQNKFLNIGKKRKVLFEYPSQNTHKEFHIGHLRNVAIGNTLVELYKKTDFKVITMNYINDYGNHVVKCLWYILNYHPEILKDKNKHNQKFLGEIYSEANNFIKDHPEIENNVKDFQVKFENQDKQIQKVWQETRDWSIKGFTKIMKDLDLKHDAIIYESEVKNDGKKIVDKLLKNKIAKIGEGGAVIVDLNKYNLDIALLRKSSGAGLYITGDLALAEKKFKKYKIEESVYITGLEQEFYFKQLFKILELSGFKKKMTHISYGLINLASGKMSSRAGNVILYEDLKNEIFAKIFLETKQKNQNWSEDKIKKTVEILTDAVLKFYMQKHEAKKNIIFDIKEAVSFEGYNALYVLYSFVRINSIFKKIKNLKNLKQIDFSLLKEAEEKKILALLNIYDEIIIKARENYNPAVITKYTFDLAQAFNDFYAKYNILNSEENLKQSRLYLIKATQTILADALKILTIKTVKEM